MILTVVLWVLAIQTHQPDIGIICKMVANVSLMLSVVLLFSHYLISKDPSRDPWPFIFKDPLALAVFLGFLANAVAICAVGTFVVFGNGAN